jgi:uncharacterized protein DUF6894
MPRYYINYRMRGLSLRDAGQDLPGLEEAKAVALASAREILAENLMTNTSSLEAVAVTDEHGQQLAMIPAKAVWPEPTICGRAKAKSKRRARSGRGLP